MVDLSRLLIGIVFGLIAQVGTFFQLQGPLKYEWLKNHYWFNVSLGIPISILFIYSVQNMILAFGGQMWPSRLIGFNYSKPFWITELKRKTEQELEPNLFLVIQSVIT